MLGTLEAGLVEGIDAPRVHSAIAEGCADRVHGLRDQEEHIRVREEVQTKARQRRMQPTMKLRRRPSASAKAPVGTSKRKATAKYTASTLLISNWLRPRALRKSGYTPPRNPPASE